MDIHFACTRCGKCCRGHKLPLGVSDALRWLRAGHPVEVLCQAAPLPGPDPDAAQAHFQRRSFAARSGTLTVNVAVILAARLDGRCPNLRDDQSCGIYDTRPVVCRVYPAEINPCIELNPGAKACPPEAWAAGNPLFQRDGWLLDAVIRDDIEEARAVNRSDAIVKQMACDVLRIDATARAGEGFVLYAPDVPQLLAALEAATAAEASPPDEQRWQFITDRPESLQALARVGAEARAGVVPGTIPVAYLGFGVLPTAPK